MPDWGVKKRLIHSFAARKRQMTAVICSGKAKLSDKECCLKDEINWLEKNKSGGFESYRAILVNSTVYEKGEDNLSRVADPPIITLSNLDSCVEPPSKQIDDISGNHISQLQNSQIYMAYSVNRTLEKKAKVNPPYTFHERNSNVYYSMLIDTESDDLNLLFRLSGFVEWLGLYKPELLFSQETNASEYLFYWLIQNIMETGGDLLNGLYKGLNTLSNHKIGGLFNLFFSDGTGVYAYSAKEECHNCIKTISFRINRDEHNIFSYVLRNSEDPDELDWIHLKANSLYYFPTRGALQNYLNINTPIRSEVKLKKCMYWNCLSLMSSNMI
jgi:hypothetical protein